MPDDAVTPADAGAHTGALNAAIIDPLRLEEKLGSFREQIGTDGTRWGMTAFLASPTHVLSRTHAPNGSAG